MAYLDWTPAELAEMLDQVAQIVEHQSDAIYEDPEVRLVATTLQMLLDARLSETQRT